MTGEAGQPGKAGHDDGRGGAGGTGGAGGDPSGVGGTGGAGGRGGSSGNSARWIFRVAISLAALLLAASLLIDRVTASNQLDYLRSQTSEQDEVSACRSAIAADLDAALAEYNLADGRIDLLITDAITALIARDNEALVLAGQRIDQANKTATEKAAALAVASERREQTEIICPQGEP